MEAATLLDADNPAHRSHAVKPRPAPVDGVVDAAIALLGLKLPPRVIVERFPDKPADYDFEGHDAAVLVIYDGSKFEPNGLREELRLVAIILVRSLDGQNGGYALIDEVRKALHDQSLAGATGTRPVEVQLEDEADGVFRWRVVFAANLMTAPGRSQRLSIPRSFPSQDRS
jgi:Gp37 protein